MPSADRAFVGSVSSRPVFVEQLASRLGWLVVLRLLFLTLLFGLTAYSGWARTRTGCCS
jgi:hypothetical protein